MTLPDLLADHDRLMHWWADFLNKGENSCD